MHHTSDGQDEFKEKETSYITERKWKRFRNLIVKPSYESTVKEIILSFTVSVFFMGATMTTRKTINYLYPTEMWKEKKSP